VLGAGHHARIGIVVRHGVDRKGVHVEEVVEEKELSRSSRWASGEVSKPMALVQRSVEKRTRRGGREGARETLLETQE
jgi:hypothetical protein